jgi:hypothetical protein
MNWQNALALVKDKRMIAQPSRELRMQVLQYECDEWNKQDHSDKQII